MDERIEEKGREGERMTKEKEEQPKKKKHTRKPEADKTVLISCLLSLESPCGSQKMGGPGLAIRYVVQSQCITHMGDKHSELAPSSSSLMCLILHLLVLLPNESDVYSDLPEGGFSVGTGRRMLCSS